MNRVRSRRESSCSTGIPTRSIQPTPPLGRIAIGLPLYLVGERYPNLPALDHPITHNDVGNAVLYDSGH
jgi:hypothetical protein